jgi:hypothetical protein
VLDTGSTVIITKFLNLRLSHTVGRFIDGHLDIFIEVSDDDGAKGGVVGVDHLVIDGPESVEVKHFLVPRGSGLHFAIRLVSDAVIHELECRHGQNIIKDFLKMVLSESGKEWTLVVDTLDKGVNCIPIGGN